MAKNVESTVDRYINSLSPKERKEYERGQEAFLIDEMVIAYTQQDFDSLKELAELSGVPSSKIANKISPAAFSKILKYIMFKYDKMQDKLTAQ